MAKKPTKAEWSTAYHEAGHAVAAYELKRRFHHVTIIPDEESGTLGHILYGGFGPNFAPDVDVSPHTRQILERAIICALAGGVAESVFLKRRVRRGVGNDYDMVVNYATYFAHSIEEAEAYIAWLSFRTEYLLTNPVAWAGVEGLAAALIERRHIGYRAARQIIRDSMDNYVFTTPDDAETA